MTKIAILSGGTGPEADIARKSAKFIKDYISEEYDYYELPRDLDIFLNAREKYSLVIPVFHGEYGEDGKIFAFLDVLNIPHTFSKYSAHSLCLNKFKTNILVGDLGVKAPKQILIKRSYLLEQEEYVIEYFNSLNNESSHTRELSVIEDKILENFPESELLELKKMKFPFIVKPNKGGSSFYTYKLNTISELIDTIKTMKSEINDDILVQEFISGEEYAVPVVNGKILPIMKLEKSEEEFFDYTSKYEDNSRIKEMFPDIEDSLKERLILDTKKIHNFFNLKGISRVDFLVKNGEIYFLEVNTIPGLNENSILPKSWKLTGKTYEDLVKEIIKKEAV